MKQVIALTLALGVAAPVLAQSQVSTVSRVDAAAAIAARQEVAQFAACLSNRAQGRIQKLTTLAVDSSDYRMSAQRLYDTSDEVCSVNGSVRYNPVLFTGALYDALYARDFAFSGPTAFPATVVTRYADRYRAPYSKDARRAIALEGFGECVARAEPEQARKLVLAAPGSAAEQQQFTALAPRFQGCVVNGATVEMSKAIVRGAVAEGLYRLSVAATNSGTGSTKGA